MVAGGGWAGGGGVVCLGGTLRDNAVQLAASFELVAVSRAGSEKQELEGGD